MAATNIEKFLAVFGYLRQQVAILAQSGQISGKMKNSTGVVISDGHIWNELPFEKVDLPVNMFSLIQATDGQISSPSFIRLNTHWFDVSFEKFGEEVIVGVASHLAIGEQLASVINELIVPRHRSSNYGVIFRSLTESVSRSQHLSLRKAS